MALKRCLHSEFEVGYLIKGGEEAGSRAGLSPGSLSWFKAAPT